MIKYTKQSTTEQTSDRETFTTTHTITYINSQSDYGMIKSGIKAGHLAEIIEKAKEHGVPMSADVGIQTMTSSVPGGGTRNVPVAVTFQWRQYTR